MVTHGSIFHHLDCMKKKSTRKPKAIPTLQPIMTPELETSLIRHAQWEAELEKRVKALEAIVFGKKGNSSKRP